MPGTNRRSSYQTAQDVLDGTVWSINGRTLKFFARTLLQVREQEQKHKQEAKSLKHQLDHIAFKQHELETLRRHFNDIRGRYERNKLRRKNQGMPEDAIPTPFALFAWYVTPRGGWQDLVGLFPSREEAEAYRRKLRRNWTNSEVVDLRGEHLFAKAR